MDTNRSVQRHNYFHCGIKVRVSHSSCKKALGAKAHTIEMRLENLFHLHKSQWLTMVTSTTSVEQVFASSISYNSCGCEFFPHVTVQVIDTMNNFAVTSMCRQLTQQQTDN